MDGEQFEALLTKLERIAEALENGTDEQSRDNNRRSCGTCRYRQAAEKQEDNKVLPKTSKTPW